MCYKSNEFKIKLSIPAKLDQADVIWVYMNTVNTGPFVLHDSEIWQKQRTAWLKMIFIYL
jgi:hypothetical protein